MSIHVGDMMEALLKNGFINREKPEIFYEMIKSFATVKNKRNNYAHGLWFTHERPSASSSRRFGVTWPVPPHSGQALRRNGSWLLALTDRALRQRLALTCCAHCALTQSGDVNQHTLNVRV